MSDKEKPEMTTAKRAKSAGSTEVAELDSGREMLIPMTLIDAPSNAMRSEMDEEELQYLKKSIDADGLLNAIIVCKKGKRYEIVAGHRRFVACQMLSWGVIPAKVTQASSKKVWRMMWAENVARSDLNHVEEAEAMRNAQRMFGWSNRQIASATGYSEQAVGQRLAILKWPDTLREAVRNGLITFSAGRELSRIDDEEVLKYYVTFALESGCTPRLAKQWVGEYEAQKAYSRAQEDPQERFSESEPTVEPLCQCYLCAASSVVSEMRTVFVHRECATKFTKIIQEAAAEEAAAS